MTRRRLASLARAALLAALAAAVGAATPRPTAAAGELLAGDHDPRIVNGLVTHDYPATGALLYHTGGNPGSAFIQCSGTLIGCNTFLTAGHCVADDSNPNRYFVFLQHAGVFSVTSVVPHDDYRHETFPLADVAVLTLGREVTGVDPVELNLADPEPFIPHPGVIVGFGQTLGGANDYGIKRAGAIETQTCQANLPQGAGNDELVCWSFSSPVGPPGEDSNTCNGDSGGPLYMDLGAGVVVAGVTSGGTNGTCGTGDHSFDANVFTYEPFIASRLSADATTACGPIPAVGAAAVSVAGEHGTLSGPNPSENHSVTLSSHVNVLRFALNGEDNGTLDADLYVRRGAPATTTSFDCKADGAGNFGACEFELPALDTWHVLVQRASGAGDYQLTTTVFGGPAPVCGNGATETGEECDGADDALCDGLCNGATCQCPPASCGNQVTEQGEECDGTSVEACLSGTCAGDCECVPACGDGQCEPGETAFGCPADCGCAAVGACAFGIAPGGCFCDPLCVSIGDCCPDACSECDLCEAGCGNGLVEIGEECDDSNTQNGDCCSSTCQLDAPSAPCDDRSACTADDVCDGDGTCTGETEVATGCFAALKSQVGLNDVAAPTQDRLNWSWHKGDAVTFVELGDPSTTTTYDLCVFDFSAGQPSLEMSARLQPGARWKSAGGKTWSYKDNTGSANGVRKVRLGAGVAGASKLKVKAKGGTIQLPGPASSSSYFDQDPHVVLQLVSGTGACWEAEFPLANTSTTSKFSAKFP